MDTKWTPGPVAYRHTLHMEGGQTLVRISEWDGVDPDYPTRTGFGIPDRDYSAEYRVTTEPLYAAAPDLAREIVSAHAVLTIILDCGWIPEEHAAPVRQCQENLSAALAKARGETA